MKKLLIFLAIIAVAGCAGGTTSADEGYVEIQMPCPTAQLVKDRDDVYSSSPKWVVCKDGRVFEWR